MHISIEYRGPSTWFVHTQCVLSIDVDTHSIVKHRKVIIKIKRIENYLSFFDLFGFVITLTVRLLCR